jgi:hypothetical protein
VQACLAELREAHAAAVLQKEEAQEQLAARRRQHDSQNADLQGVLCEAQLALRHLRGEKARIRPR